MIEKLNLLREKVEKKFEEGNSIEEVLEESKKFDKLLNKYYKKKLKKQKNKVSLNFLLRKKSAKNNK